MIVLDSKHQNNQWLSRRDIMLVWQLFLKYFLAITIISQEHFFVSLVKHQQHYEKKIIEGSSHEWQTCLTKKKLFCPAAAIGQITGVNGHFQEIGQFRNLHLFFFFHPYIKTMLQNIFFKEKLLVISVLLVLLSSICSYFLEHFENLTISVFGLQKTYLSPQRPGKCFI